MMRLIDCCIALYHKLRDKLGDHGQGIFTPNLLILD